MVIWLQQFFMQVLIWLLAFVDCLGSVFGALAGIETIQGKGGETTLTSYFLSLNAVQKGFWIVLLASVVICGVCTIVAIVKSVINAKGGEPKSHARTICQAMSTLFISLFMAAFLICGVGLADKLLATISNELNGGVQTMSANIIDVSLGSRVLYDTENVQGLNREDDEGEYTYISYLYRFETDDDGMPRYYEEIDGYEEKHLLKYIDPSTNKAFDSWEGAFDLSSDGMYTPKLSEFELVYDKTGWVGDNDKSSLKPIWEESVASLFGDYKTNAIGMPTVWKNTGKIYPGSFNFVVAFLTTTIIAFALIVAAFGLVKRLYDIVLLFISLPGVVATIPLDDGAKFKLWRETVISKVFLAFGSVLAVNVFFIVAPSLWEIEIPGAVWLVNVLLKVFLVCGGALTIFGGQLLFARLLGTSAEESREMGQSARTLMGGAMAGLGAAKAVGRGLFGYRNANGQRVGGAVKGAASALGTLGMGGVNAAGNALGGQAYRGSKLGKGVSATQQALRGFGSSTGWFGKGTVGGAIGDAIGSGFSKLSGSKMAQKSGLNNGLYGATVGNVRKNIDAKHAASRQSARDMMSQGNAALTSAHAAADRVAADAVRFRNATALLHDDFGREVVAGFEGGAPTTLPAVTDDKK